MKPRIYVCEVCGSPAGETCWRCWRETYGGALAFVVLALVALCL